MSVSYARNGRITVIFDDTDEATPVLVQIKRETSTYWCAREVGTVGSFDEIDLTERELEWLDTLEDRAAACEMKARADWR